MATKKYKDYHLQTKFLSNDIPAQENLAYAKANLEARESLTDVAIEGLRLWCLARQAKIRKASK